MIQQELVLLFVKKIKKIKNQKTRSHSAYNLTKKHKHKNKNTQIDLKL